MRQVDTPRRAMRAAVMGDVHGTCLLCLCAGGILEVHIHLVIYIYIYICIYTAIVYIICKL